MRADIVIAGAGLAGASTAFHLARAGRTDVLLLEREAAPGAHASGRNAGVLRRLVEEPDVVPLAREGAAVLESPPPDLAPRSFLRKTGSVLVFPEADGARMAALGAAVGARLLSPLERARLAPELRADARGAAIHTPDDGLVDPRAILSAYIHGARARGVRLETGIEARALVLEGGRVAGLETSRGRIEARVVVDAAGAWAGALAERAGLPAPAFRALRRHVILADLDPERPSPHEPRSGEFPFLWDVLGGFYVRPGEGGKDLLFSPCDETPVERPSGGGPGDIYGPGETVDPACERDLFAKLRARAPSFARIEALTARACLRTFSPDRRFVIGPDPRTPGLFYVAGLGGHGVTASWPIGAIAARAILDPASAPPEFAPARLEMR